MIQSNVVPPYIRKYFGPPRIGPSWNPNKPIKGYRRPDVLSNDSLTILQKIQQFQYVQHTTKDAAYYLAKSLWLGSPNAEVNQSDFGPTKLTHF